VPATTALVSTFLAGGGLAAGNAPDAAFRADALALAAAVAVAAFAGGDVPSRLARAGIAAVLLGAARAGLGAPEGAPAGGPAALAALAAGAMLGVLGLRAVGERARCPSPVAGALAGAVLWTACAGVWWADALAAAVPLERRGAVREAVLALDPFTAAAYDVHGWDRMKDSEIYAETTVATLPMRRPNAPATAASWGATGLLAGLVALALRPRADRTRARPADVPVPAAEAR
jgi:hypothetical protein